MAFNLGDRKNKPVSRAGFQAICVALLVPAAEGRKIYRSVKRWIQPNRRIQKWFLGIGTNRAWQKSVDFNHNRSAFRSFRVVTEREILDRLFVYIQ